MIWAWKGDGLRLNTASKKNIILLYFVYRKKKGIYYNSKCEVFISYKGRLLQECFWLMLLYLHRAFLCFCTPNLVRKFLLGMPHVLKHLTFVTYFLRTCFSFPVLSKPVSLTFDIKRMYFKKDWARRIMVPCHVLYIEKKFLETLWACIQLNKIHIEFHSTSFQQIYLWIRLQSMPYVLFRLLQR